MKPWAFRLSVLLLAIVADSAAIRAQTTAWRIEPSHSSAQFSVRHMMISIVRGCERRGCLRRRPSGEIIRRRHD
jgi:polyisoprenoid-binding protein YceI